ncbi:HesA/MoeB/ThiF family protein [Glycomyces harbinensis]|uniref:ThiF family protein n=1 Tax=Glycomyces harbinensis TaxID=58114 RepID=A0A1G6XCC5_9ACTN|nr:ThiF family adenylyltransferase [Glycomyces harbinensis]SDD74945.1 ThiF family protein [Glycomyces harbinensis]
MSADAPAHAVVPEGLARLVLREGLTSLRATVHDGGDLLRVHPEAGPDLPVLRVEDTQDAAAEALRRFGSDSPPALVCAVGDAIAVLARHGGTYRPVDLTLLPEKADVFDRVRGVFETDALRDKSVAVLGIGSGGSFILRELARCGVGRFLLVDHDRIEVGNVCRHESGLADVGRLKVHAGRSMVLDRNPAAKVETSPLQIGDDTFAAFSDLMNRFAPDVVVCATDNRASRMLVNRYGLMAGVPSFYAGVFRRAYGGQVLRVISDLTPCYQCFIHALPDMAADREISSTEDASAIAYSDREVAVEPGLSSDIVPIALQVAKLAMLELLDGTPTTLDSLYDDLVAPLYLWINRREPDSDYARWQPMATGVEELSIMRWYGIGVPRNPECAACGTKSLEGVLPEDAVPLQPGAHVEPKPSG